MSSSRRSSSCSSRSSKSSRAKNFLSRKFRSFKKKILRRKTSDSEKSSRSKKEKINHSQKKVKREPDLVIDGWISHCLKSNMVSTKDRMNMLFAPLPSLEAYVAMNLAMGQEERKIMRGVFFVNEEYCNFIAARLKQQSAISPSDAHSFFHLITDDSPDARVHGSYMRLIQQYFGPTTIVSCNPSNSSEYLRELTGGMLVGPKSVAGQTIGYSSAAVRANWDGKTSTVVRAPFATSYSERQEHAFFRLTTEKTKTTTTNGFEAWSLPLISSDPKHSFRLVLLRPEFLGSILEMRRKLTAKQLHEILGELEREESEEHRVLLPFFSLAINDDLWTRWMTNFPTAFNGIRESAPFPCLGHMWHSAIFSLTNEGVGINYRSVTNKSLPSSLKKYVDIEEVIHRSPSYSIRFDSPFLFLVISEQGLPFLSGCYAGSPPALKKNISIPIPPRILAKPPPDWSGKDKKPSQKKKENCLTRNFKRIIFWEKVKKIFKKGKKGSKKSSSKRSSKKSSKKSSSSRSSKSSKSSKSSSKSSKASKRPRRSTWV